jgi:hypothetical protein
MGQVKAVQVTVVAQVTPVILRTAEQAAKVVMWRRLLMILFWVLVAVEDTVAAGVSESPAIPEIPDRLEIPEALLMFAVSPHWAFPEGLVVMVALVVMVVTEATTVIVAKDLTMANLLIHHPFPEAVVVILQVGLAVRDVV